MSTSSMKILCRYQYDPLDRLTGLRPAEHVGTQRFYQNDDLVNEIEGQIQLTILRHEAQPLAQRLHIANVAETTLLATDQQRSVLQTLTATDTRRLVYTAYGHQPAESGLSSLLGFNGERPDPITGHYLLGQGNRAFNPVLMRFNSPDELSPFGDGGINPYAYCGGDPVNRYDPSGNIPLGNKPFFRPWTDLMTSEIVMPTAQARKLNPFSKAIYRDKIRSTRAVVTSPPKPLRYSVTTHSSFNDFPAIPDPIPFEGPRRGGYKVDDITKDAQRMRNTLEVGRTYDKFITDNSNIRIFENMSLRTDFEIAQSHLKALKESRALLKEMYGSEELNNQLKIAQSKYQHLRLFLKRSNLFEFKKIVGRIRKP